MPSGTEVNVPYCLSLFFLVRLFCLDIEETIEMNISRIDLDKDYLALCTRTRDG